MNAKRILSLFLAAVLTLGVAVTPARQRGAGGEQRPGVHQADGLRPAGVRLSV